jgi:hypothetical protein
MEAICKNREVGGWGPKSRECLIKKHEAFQNDWHTMQLIEFSHQPETWVPNYAGKSVHLIVISYNLTVGFFI